MIKRTKTKQNKNKIKQTKPIAKQAEKFCDKNVTNLLSFLKSAPSNNAILLRLAKCLLL